MMISSQTYQVPQKAIHSHHDFESFMKSSSHTEILDFVKECAEAIVDIPNNNNSEELNVASFPVTKFVEFMNELSVLIDEVPPIKQPMRFGNKAFRTWHERLLQKIPIFLDNLLPEENNLKEASIEFGPYLADMFGNPTRIDYGTGHELNFAVFFLLCYKLQIINRNDLSSVIAYGYVSYIQTMRKLQTIYMLEPAGSHGVWGLDDYHCLLFVWGSAQLSKQSMISPSSVHNMEILQEYASEYIYLEGIQFIKQIKSSAPFAETSPMLNDISHLSDWAKICAGLMRLFQGEVLNKFPVIQHLVFGTLLPCTWKTTTTSTSAMTSNHHHPNHIHNNNHHHK